MSDIYVYDYIPEKLRIQVVHIWNDAFGTCISSGNLYLLYEKIYNILCREYGLFKLVEYESDNSLNDLAEFLLVTDDPEKVLDCIELSFQYIEKVFRDPNYVFSFAKPKLNPDQAIAELNQRFLEHGVGYQYEAGNIVKMDSKIIHTDVVKPVLVFLSKQGFEGANQEFLLAHEHYRRGRYKECLNECLKSLESTLKTICIISKWLYKDTDTASTLINICFKNNLVPAFLQSQFTALRSTLESGVPTIRNKVSGHGQGAEVVTMPSYLAAYQLHLTAATILFLAEALVID